MRKQYNNHFKSYVQTNNTADLHIYSTKSATWLYNRQRDVVVLFVDDSDGMTNDTIVYDKSAKNFEKHKSRILRLAA